MSEDGVQEIGRAFDAELSVENLNLGVVNEAPYLCGSTLDTPAIALAPQGHWIIPAHLSVICLIVKPCSPSP